MKVRLQQPQFSLYFFLWTNLLTLALIFLAYRLVMPELWSVQLNAAWYTLVIGIALAHLAFAFVEFFFHRYALHANYFRVFNYFYTQHNLHHSKTDVETHGAHNLNYYSIEHPEQREASFFPWYAFPLFAIGFTPVIAGIALMSSWPILIIGYAALLLTITLYEFFHQIFHLPLSWWQPWLSHPRYQSVARRIYAFHLDHHRNFGCNESVSGWFGIPITDLLFGTYHYSGELYPHQEPVQKNSALPQPVWLVRILDRIFIKQR